MASVAEVLYTSFIGFTGCVEMYNAIIKLRTGWASGPKDDDNGKSFVAKIVMTGSARTI